MAMFDRQIGHCARHAEKRPDEPISLDDIFEKFIDIDIFELDNIPGPGDLDKVSTPFVTSLSATGNRNVTNASHVTTWDTLSCPDESQEQMTSHERGGASLVAANSRASIYPSSYGKASASDPELFSLMNFIKEQPPSPISSPPLSQIPSAPCSPTSSKFGFSIAKAQQRQNSHGNISSPLNMMSRSPYRDENEQIRSRGMKAVSKLVKVPTAVKNHFPVSPPTSGKIPQVQFPDPYGVSKFGYGIDSHSTYEYSCNLESSHF
jgi:hypothetical protein